MTENSEYTNDVVIVGGLGHVGLPLGIALADKGLKTCLYDVNMKTSEQVMRGEMPFVEYGAEPLLKHALAEGTLTVSSDGDVVGSAPIVIVAIGTPVDEHLNPKTRQFLELFEELREHMHGDQIVIIRSTIYPRTCHHVAKALKKEGDSDWHVAYCPERITQGYAIKELAQLPQLVSGVTDRAVQVATELFEKIAPRIVHVSVAEAELAKLYTNTWRYIQFAVANQFYMMAHNFGVDYERVRDAMTDGYERTIGLPRAGFAAGPCLLKDTMQLAAFSNSFMLGHSAMMINEGLPNYLVDNLRSEHNLEESTVGILGMAFKADIDDIRDSLSYKLGKLLRFHGANVRYSDEFAKDPSFVSKETLIADSDIIIVGIPHSAYKDLPVPGDKHVVDLWGVVRHGS